MTQFGLRLKNFQVRIFICAFLTWIKHIFYRDMRSSEVQCNGGAAWMWQPRCLCKGLKVYNLLEESFDLRLDVLPLLSGEVYFLPLSPRFWVAASTIWSDVHVLNFGLSLLLSILITIKNKLPYKLVGEVVVVQLIWPLLAVGGNFGPLQILWMRTFASEFVQEPLKGVHPYDYEVIPLFFNAIATRCASLVMHMWLFC